MLGDRELLRYCVTEYIKRKGKLARGKERKKMREKLLESVSSSFAL